MANGEKYRQSGLYKGFFGPLSDWIEGKGSLKDCFEGTGIGNWFKSFAGSGMTDKAKEEMDFANELEYQKYDDLYSLNAQIQNGKEAGVNPFVIVSGGASPSVSSATPSNSASSASPLDFLGMIMNFALKKQDLEVQREKNDLTEKLNESIIHKNDSQSEYFGAQVDRINQLIPLEKENFAAKTSDLLQSINESKSREALNNAGISVAEAEAELKLQQAAIAAIDASHKDEYWENNARLQIAQEALTYAETARNYVEANRARQEIVNLQTQNDNLLKEGIGILLENGKLAHEFTILGLEADNAAFKIKHENRGLIIDNVCTCINAGVNVLTGASSVWRASSYSSDTNNRWAYKAALAAIRAAK